MNVLGFREGQQCKILQSMHQLMFFVCFSYHTFSSYLQYLLVLCFEITNYMYIHNYKPFVL